MAFGTAGRVRRVGTTTGLIGVLALIVAACGGGDSGGATPDTATPPADSAGPRLESDATAPQPDERLVISSDDDLATLTIPAGQVGSDVSVTVRATDLPDGISAVDGVDVYSYRLEPSGLRFTKPAMLELRLPQSAEKSSTGIATAQTILITTGSDAVEPLVTTVWEDGDELVIAAEVTHFSEVHTATRASEPTRAYQLDATRTPALWGESFALKVTGREPATLEYDSERGLEARYRTEVSVNPETWDGFTPDPDSFADNTQPFVAFVCDEHSEVYQPISVLVEEFSQREDDATGFDGGWFTFTAPWAPQVGFGYRRVVLTAEATCATELTPALEDDAEEASRVQDEWDATRDARTPADQAPATEPATDPATDPPDGEDTAIAARTPDGVVPSNCTETTITDSRCDLDPLPTGSDVVPDCPYRLDHTSSVPDSIRYASFGLWQSDNGNIFMNLCSESNAWDPASGAGFDEGWTSTAGIGNDDSASASSATLGYSDATTDGLTVSLDRERAELFAVEASGGAGSPPPPLPTTKTLIWFVGLNSSEPISGTAAINYSGPGGQSETVIIPFTPDNITAFPGGLRDRYPDARNVAG